MSSLKHLSKKDKIKIRTSMIKDVQILHNFFKDQGKNGYKISDYVLDGETPFLLYNLIDNRYNGVLYISISNKFQKDRVLNKLNKRGIDFVKILKRRAPDVISEWVNQNLTNENDNKRITSVWSYEKLFLYLDTFNFYPDQKQVAIKKLSFVCDIEKLRKLKELHSKTKRPISKAVQNYFNGKKNYRKKLRNKDESFLMNEVIKVTRDDNRILYGGFAVENYLIENYPDNIRSTRDVDFLSPRESFETIKNRIRESGLIIKSEKVSDISKLVVQKEGADPDKDEILVIDFDHSLHTNEIKELKERGVVIYKENVGNILSPAGIVCCKLDAITDKGISMDGKWRFRIVKDLLDISSLYKLEGISRRELKTAYVELKKRRIIVINPEKFEPLMSIVRNDQNYFKSTMELTENNGFIIGNFDTEKYLKEVFECINEVRRKNNRIEHQNPKYQS